MKPEYEPFIIQYSIRKMTVFCAIVAVDPVVVAVVVLIVAVFDVALVAAVPAVVVKID